MKPMFPAHWGPRRVVKSGDDDDQALQSYTRDMAAYGATGLVAVGLALCSVIHFVL